MSIFVPCKRFRTRKLVFRETPLISYKVRQGLWHFEEKTLVKHRWMLHLIIVNSVMNTKRKASNADMQEGGKRCRADELDSLGALSSDEDTGHFEDTQILMGNTLKFSLNGGNGLHAFDNRNVIDAVSHIFQRDDFSWLSLKPDHEARPLWISPRNGKIIMESFSALAGQAQDFLTTISEPLSRPKYLHEYRLTPHSLYAAVSVGLDPRDIISVLDRLSKTPLAENIISFINSCTGSYGRVKLVLKQNRYFVESNDAAMLQKLLQDEIIGSLRIMGMGGEFTIDRVPQHGPPLIPGSKGLGSQKRVAKNMPSHAMVPTIGPVVQQEKPEEPSTAPTLAEGEEDEEDEGEIVHSFEIPKTEVETVQKRCLTLECPILEEYDFRADTLSANLNIDLQPKAQIRPYQEKSLSKMFGNGRAKSGIIVLPCGAGKTLVGVTAACTIKKSVVVLCTSSMSVVQWRQQFLQWCNIHPDAIAIFTSENKEKFKGDAGIIVTTYSMVTNSRNRSYESQRMMDFLTSRDWGLMIFDEVALPSPLCMYVFIDL